MTTPAAGRPGKSLDVLILVGAVLAIGCGLTWFLARQGTSADRASAPVEALNSLALESSAVAAGDTRALTNFESALKELRAAASAAPDAPFAQDARYKHVVSNAGTVLQARGALSDASIAAREARDVVPKL